MNHLVAKVYQEGNVDFSEETNPNVIYEGLFSSVFHRENWSGNQFEPIAAIDEKDFNRIIEETAVCAWHGGRCATLGAIEARCAPQFKSVIETLSGRAKNPVSLILTGFFFRESSENREAERTIEFTHKTFYEYLTARKIVRELANISRKMARRLDDPSDGLDETKALVDWAELFGPTAMDQDLFGFLANEVTLRSMETVKQWQTNLKTLIDHMLRRGMPMQRLDPRPRYREEDRMARNAEEALLACISACALTTGKTHDIDWPENNSAGDWICRLRGQRKLTELFWCFSLSLLNHIGLKGQELVGQDLGGAVLVGADLSGTNLRMANLEGANLRTANFERAYLANTNLSGACLTETILTEAILDGADLDHSNLADAIGITLDSDPTKSQAKASLVGRKSMKKIFTFRCGYRKRRQRHG